MAYWFVTFVTHNSRISERMITYGVQKGEPLIFSTEQQVIMLRDIAAICEENKFHIPAFNFMPDHVHLIIAAPDVPVLNQHVRIIKGGSSYRFQRQVGAERGQHIWAQKFNHQYITEEKVLADIAHYVTYNHLKHGEKWGDAYLANWTQNLHPLIQQICHSSDQ